MSAPPTVGAWLADAARRLGAHNPDAARDARLLVLPCWRSRRPPSWPNPKRPLSAEEFERLEELVPSASAARRFSISPASAPSGTSELTVGPGVFVPRPETEGLVEHVLASCARAAGANRPASSTCAPERRHRAGAGGRGAPSEVTAIERSETAAACARANARRLLGPEQVHRWTAPRRRSLRAALRRRMPNEFDVIVANPPYIPDGMWGTLPARGARPRITARPARGAGRHRGHRPHRGGRPAWLARGGPAWPWKSTRAMPRG
jgi:release factor glutamine methyltransferase